MLPERGMTSSSERPRKQWQTPVCLAVLLLVGSSIGGCSDSRQARPHVVLIVLDTARADFFSSYGFPDKTTPVFDRLASEGTRYSSAFSTSFWTLPGHASLFTGLYPSEAGATSETNRLPGEVSTIAELLREAGYRTLGSASNPWLTEERGFHQGFEDFREVWREDPDRARFAVEEIGVEDAVDWIEESARGENPFFLFLNFNSPHMPYTPPPDLLSRFVSPDRSRAQVRRLMEVAGPWKFLAGELSLNEGDFEALREMYAGEIAVTDRYVDAIVEALEKEGILDDTLLIVTSDHGENIGDHGMIDHALSMYDTTVRVPLVIRYPERFEAGAVVDDLVSLVDVVPTILDASELIDESNRERVEHRSLCSNRRERRPFVVAENDRPVNAVRLLSEMFPGFDTTSIDRPLRMIRTDRHKLIWPIGGEPEVYDLERDPNEKIDITGVHPELEEVLTEQLRQWMSTVESGPSTRPLESLDEEALERLRSLGYVE
jgi:arylsulfatase A-like enzyme